MHLLFCCCKYYSLIIVCKLKEFTVNSEIFGGRQKCKIRHSDFRKIFIQMNISSFKM